MKQADEDRREPVSQCTCYAGRSGNGKDHSGEIYGYYDV